MGQQQCGAPQHESDDDFFRGSLITTNPDEVSILSYCKSMGVGKYMDSKSTKKVVQMWEQLILQTDLKTTHINIKAYQQQSMLSSDQEFHQKVQKHYRFVVTRPDLAVLMLYTMDSKGLTHLLRQGVPHQLRWPAWKTFLLYRNLDYVKPVLFENMITQDCEHFACIEKDVMRTLISHHFFIENPQNYGQQQLMRVLIAIANYVPKLGYCQGMNFLVGFLLMISGCDESLSFSCMVSLLLDQRYLLYYFYCDGLPLFLLIQNMALKLLAKNFPKLDTHLKRTETPESFWLTKILLSIFLYVLQIQDCMRLWDYFIARGSIKGYLELICGVCDQIQDQMMRCDNLEIAGLFAGSAKTTLRIDVNQAILKAQTKYRLKKSQIAAMAEGAKPNTFEAIFMNFNNKALFSEQITAWSARIV